MLINQSDNVRGASNEYFQLEVPIEARYLRIINLHCTTGKFSLSGLRAFGKIDKSLPAEVHGLIAARHPKDHRKVSLCWSKVERAMRYNIRFGSDKNKLYHNYQVYSAESLSINVLNMELPYYFVIDSFNEAGVTRGTEMKEIL